MQITIAATMQRREVLSQLGRGAALLALGALFAREAGSRDDRVDVLTPGDDPFTLGVASGMPTPDSVVLWTRLAPRPREPLGGLPDAAIRARWELAEDERFSIGRREGEVVAQAEHAHSLHVEVTGLPSDRYFFYRFHCGDASSPVGRTRTAPAPDAAVGRLRFALASCQHYEQGQFAVHREIAARDFDFVLFVGDYLYESSNPRYRIRPHEGPAPTTLAGYRQRHVTYKLDASLRAAHAAHPWLLTWDDHEVENDYAGDASRDPLRDTAAFLRMRAAAYKAYFEHMPVSPRRPPVGPSMRIHEHYPWGRLADLWTLDNRQYRSQQPCNPPGLAGGRMLMGCEQLQDDGATIFGRDQERWIAGQLAGSERGWRLLAQGSQIAPSGIATPMGRSIFSDGWDGYPKPRERLLQAIAAQPLGNVVCLGGDVHRHVAAQLHARAGDESSAIVASEFVTSSLTSRGLPDTMMAAMRASNPGLLHARSDERGYASIELTPQTMRCDFRATAFPVEAQARVRSQARFVVEAGRAGPQREG